MNYKITDIVCILQAKCDIVHECTVSDLLTDSRSLTFPEKTLFFALVTKQVKSGRVVSLAMRHFMKK